MVSNKNRDKTTPLFLFYIKIKALILCIKAIVLKYGIVYNCPPRFLAILKGKQSINHLIIIRFI